MANRAHLERLKRGADAWNAWRRRSNVRPDLRGAVLDDQVFIEADFCGVDFRDAMLERTSFLEADLSGADLRGADLNGANLGGACLNDALLQETILAYAMLGDASLGDALLMGADLTGANLWGADLWGADMTGVRLGRTVFAATVLQNIDGLDACFHDGPSVIDHETIALSDTLPLEFLRGCGLSDPLLEFYYASHVVPVFHSCFISYSHTDKEFANRLAQALQTPGIRCWLDEKQLSPGDDIYEGLDKGIHLSDKVLLCCSEASLTSWWVDHEIAKAFAKEQKLTKERQRKVQILIPLDLDGYMFKWSDGKATEIRGRFAADFKTWQTDISAFDQGIERIMARPGNLWVTGWLSAGVE